MRSARKSLATAAVVSLGLSLAACRGSADDDAASDSVASEATTAGTEAATDETTAGSEAPDGTDAATDATTAGTDAAGSDGTAAAGSDETPVNEAAKAIECPASEQGLTDTSISLGGTYALSGPLAAYASIPKGIDAWFQHLNDTNGGITSADGKTRELTWKYLDDQYTPNKTLENARLLVEQEKVWLVLNALGTGPNMAIRDYMNQQKVPQLLVATGAATWGNDIEEYPYTIGYQPDYESDGVAYADYALAQNPDAKIGILYANDDFGKDNLTGIKRGLGDKVDQIVAEVTYETTDATIDSQISQIKDAGADTFIMIATPQFAIQGIKRVNDLGWEPVRIMSSVSASVGAVITPAGPDVSEGWVSDAYLKDSTDPAFADDPGIVEYKEILAKYYPDANPDDAFYLYGMSVAQTYARLIESLPTVCRDSVMAAVKNFEWEQPTLTSPGIGIKTGPGDGFPIQQVQMMQWDGTKWVRDPEIIDASAE